VITHVVNGIILNHTGPWPGSFHDIEMFRQSGILESLTQCEALLGDKSYQGKAQLITLFSCPISIGKIRQSVAHTFAKVKKIGCLKQVWRHSLNRYCKTFHVFCEAINCGTLCGLPKMNVISEILFLESDSPDVDRVLQHV
jgi:hypothetical protein